MTAAVEPRFNVNANAGDPSRARSRQLGARLAGARDLPAPEPRIHLISRLHARDEGACCYGRIILQRLRSSRRSAAFPGLEQLAKLGPASSTPD